MLLSLLVATTVAHAEPGDIIELHPDAAAKFKAQMEDCAMLHGWSKCHSFPTLGFGTTGKERVIPEIRRTVLTMVASPRLVSLFEGSVETYQIEIHAPIRGYAIVDVDDDGLEDLVYEDTDGIRWVIPFEDEHDGGHR